MNSEDQDSIMLMNFDDSNVGAMSVRSGSIKVTGGKWKDRRRIKLKLERGKKRSLPIEIKDDEASKYVEKRINSGVGGDGNKKVNSSKPNKIQPLNGKSQVVSSLFTSNRESSTRINSFEQDESIEVVPSNAPMLENSFEGLGITGPLLGHLNQTLKINKPTKIQMLALPEILKVENDLFIHAQTGSGKTLAFLLPILQTILSLGTRIDRKSGTFAMIIAPTRELAQQIYNVANTLAQCCHYLVPCLLIGGERKKSEKARLRKGTNFIIGTPGRILDHLENTKVIRQQLLYSLRYLVLDEGDKLMELGFEETINKILNIIHDIPCDKSKFPKLPSRIIHILCSATRKDSVNKLGHIVLENHKLISSVENMNKFSTVPDQLLQKVTFTPLKLRLVTLAAYLNNSIKQYKGTNLRIIVFLSCADSVEFHFEVFSASKGHYKDLVGETVRALTKDTDIFPCIDAESTSNIIFYKIHGSHSQQNRTSTIKHFADESQTTHDCHKILFCTDVASRGLDLPQVSIVIELDPPFAVEDHLHRVGRTARAGITGQSLLFLLPGEEESYLDHIKPYHPQGWKLLKYDHDILKPAFSNATVLRTDKKNFTSFDAQWDTNATTWHLNVERRILEDPHFMELALKGYTSHLRAYATHISNEKSYFNLKCLHLGHLAKSFALRERPKDVANFRQKFDTPVKALKEDTKSKMLRMARNFLSNSNNEFNYI